MNGRFVIGNMPANRWQLNIEPGAVVYKDSANALCTVSVYGYAMPVERADLVRGAFTAALNIAESVNNGVSVTDAMQVFGVEVVE